MHESTKTQITIKMKKLLYIPILVLLAACSSKPKDKAAELAESEKATSRDQYKNHRATGAGWYSRLS
jgi:uncharacterized lipoprotein YmbA